MTIKIRIANNDYAEEWDTIISKSPHGTIFHQWNWLKITEKHTHTKLYPLIGLKGSTAVGVIPLFFQKKGPVRMVFSPPPHASIFYLGPILIDYDTLKQEKREDNYIGFQRAIEKFISSDLRAHYISISLPPNLLDPRPFTWSGYTTSVLYDYEIDLSPGPDYLLQTLSKKHRQNLNHAKKRNIIVELGGKKEYELILHLMEIRYLEQKKIITASRDYFLDIYDAYKNDLRIFVVKIDGEVITGNIEFQYRDTLYSWVGYPKPQIPVSISPNDLIIWESVRYACENGFKYYTTMGAAGNERLHTFYAERLDPKLKIRYSATKKSIFAGILEKGYSNILKPMRGRIKHLISEE